MVLQQVNLYNFRNFLSLNLSILDPRVILIGNNAQGKSNILEAIYISSWGGSFRRIRPDDPINWNQDSARVEIGLKDSSGENAITVVFKRRDKWECLLNKNTSLKKREAARYLAAFYFSPFIEKYIHGEPSFRRRIFDIIISQKINNYSILIAKYSKIIKNRNFLLKRAKFDELKVWDDALVAVGSEIILRRALLIKEINNLMVRALMEISEASDDSSGVQIAYNSSLLPRGEVDKVNQDSRAIIIDNFREALARNLDKEKRFKQSLVGPHRDEFLFNKNGRDLRFYSSRGEGLRIVSALKIAQFDYLGQNVASPVFLVDDLLQELDREKSRLFMAAVSRRGQVVVATAHEESLSPEVMSGQKYQIKNDMAKPWLKN